MPNNKVIFLDMDGVLVDFVGGTCDLFGWKEEEVSGEWNYYKGFGMASSDFYGSIAKAGAAFWSNLKPLPHARTLWDYCREICPTYFLSTPTLDPGSVAGKYQWLVEWTGDKRFDKFAFTYHKHLSAKPHHLLIDDREENIEAFKKHGGSTILFPTKWNKRRHAAADCLSYTKREIDRWLKT